MSQIADVRLQWAAITLAEEMNFTRAADRLRITQPALSKQITELESRVGFVIFKRDKKKVELTEAGQVLVIGFRDAMAILEKTIRSARSEQVRYLDRRSILAPAWTAFMVLRRNDWL